MSDMASSYYYPPASAPPPTQPPHHMHAPAPPYYPQPAPPPPGVAPAGYSYDYQPPRYPPAAGGYGYEYEPMHAIAPVVDEVRTIFVAGLPGDTKPRELYNLFRDFPGYVSCQLRNSNKSEKAYGFAVFADQQTAVAAMHTVNGMVFDLEKGSALHVDLAKSNSRSKRIRDVSDDLAPGSFDKKTRRSMASSFSGGFPDAGAGSNFHTSGMSNSSHSLIGFPSAPSSKYEVMRGPSSSIEPSAGSQNNAPCPTLFVANLTPTCSEQELIQVFSRCTGFLKLVMQNRFGAPVAFVDFQDVNCSSEALNQLQGFVLNSSPGEGMRLEFAKSRMGMKKSAGRKVK